MANIATTEFRIELETPNHHELYVKVWTPEITSFAVPIILLHDSLGAVQLWRDFPEQLAQMTQRKVIAYDRLGFGQSSVNLEKLSPNFVNEEATTSFTQVLEHCHIEDFIVMGHSVGGGMAVCCATQYPDRCKAVITMSAQSMVEELTLSGIREAKMMFQQAGQIDRLKKYHGEKAQWVLDAWTETWLSATFQNWCLDNYLKQMICPLLIIHGELDEYGTLAQPQRLAKYSAGESHLHILNGLHHMPHKEMPDHVLNIIQAFLEKLSFD